MVFALAAFGGQYVPALLAAIVASALLGVVLYEGFLKRLRERDFESSILITTGISIVLLYGCQYLFGATPRLSESQLGMAGVEVGDIRITWTRITAAGIALVSFGVLWLLLYRTQFGRAMRAVANNSEAALMIGIRPAKVARNAVIVATILAGVAGAALAPIHPVQPIMGQLLIFKAFALVIIGGLGSIGGAILAGVAMGVLESWIGGFFPSIFQEVAAFVLMIAVLILKPAGLFGRSELRLG
jgi:branched-chain amino acid transport system permease protein